MAYYRRVGEVPRKRHSRFPNGEGGLHNEELMGQQGFSSSSSLLYHLHSPTAIVAAEKVDDPTVGAPSIEGSPGRGQPLDNRPLLPRHFRTHRLDARGDTVTGRRLLLANEDIRLCYATAEQAGPLYRNAIGDELVFVEEGAAVLESMFGALPVGEGDYVVIPASTTHRFVPETATLRTLILESSGHFHPPARYMSGEGQFLEHAPYCERDLRSPEAPVIAADEETEVLVRHRGGLTRYTYAHHPFDVVGWDGHVYPYAVSIHDFEPIVKRFHAPPPVHQTFEAPGAVICSFCPRPWDFDPEAIPVPYHHANVDSDEVLFYVGGDFMSRKGAGIETGSISLHPAGFVHGPQPGSLDAALRVAGTNEVAVMIDTFRPLRIGEAASSVEDTEYAWSWARRSN
jgi:homogentisate 1,2-dioxygenase